MRSFLAALTGLALAVVVLVVPAPAPQASALSEGLGFTADDLPTWQTNGTVWALAAAGNTVYAGGTFSQVRPPDGAGGSPVSVNSFVVLDASTGSPTSCRPAVELAGGTPTIRALDVSPDGKTLYVGGAFSKIGGVFKSRLAAIDIATCTVKTDFRPTGVSSTVRAIDSSNDTVYFGGDFLRVDGQDRQRFAAVDATTGALKPWVADADLQGKAVSVGEDGTTVAIGGNFFTVNGQDSHAFAVVDATSGANVRNYPRGFVPDTTTIQGTTADSAGYYGAAEGTGGGVFDGSFAIDYSSLTERWRDLCLGATQALVVDRGTLYEANHHHDCSQEGGFADGLRMYLTANDAQSGDMVAWRPTLNDGVSIGPRSLTVGAKGTTRYLWVGGEFTLTNRNPQQGLTRFASSGDVGAPDAPVPTAQSLRTGEIQVAWRTSFDDDDGNLRYDVFRDGSSTPIATVNAESRWWTRPQASFVDTSAAAGRTYSYRVTASDGTNTSGLSRSVSATAATSDVPYASQVLDDGANLYWRYDDASGRYGTDSSPADREPNYMKAVTYRAGTNAAQDDPGSSMGFDGATAYAYNDKLAPAPTTYSVETWFKTTTNRGGKIVGFGNGVPNTLGSAGTQLSGSYDRHVYMTNDGKLMFGAYTGSTVTVSSADSYNDGEWHSVVATQGSGGMTLYVDGKRVARNSNSVAQSYPGSWRVGGDNLSGWPSRPSSDFFAGQIDETAVYPTALSAGKVRSHFEASGREVSVPPAPSDTYGAAVRADDPELYWRLDEAAGAATAADAGAYGVSGVIAGQVATQGPSALESGTGRSASFTPTSSSNGGTIGSSTTFSNPTNYSMELWFQSQSTSGGKLIGFGDQQTSLSSNYDRHVYLQDDGKLVFGVWTGSENKITTSGSYTDGTWHHLVATQSSTNGMSLYVDGELAGSNPQTSSQSYTGYWKVGGDNTWGSSSPYFTGRMDEVAVYGSVLSAADVAEHYALGTGETPPDATPPSTPTGLAADTTGDDAVALTWDAATDDTGVAQYVVHRSDDEDFAPSSATRIGTSTGTTYDDDGPGAGTWYYRVVAVDAAGNSGPASDPVRVELVGPDTTAPSTPSGVATEVDGTSVALTWEASSDERGVSEYRVFRSGVASFVPSASTRVGVVEDGVAFTQQDVPVGTWYYKVVAVDAAGNVSGPSGAARADVLGPDTTAPSVPTGLTGAASGTSVQLAWSASTDDRALAGYRVYRSASATVALTPANLANETTSTNWTDTGRAVGTWRYVVVAVDEAGNVSGPSATVAVAVAAPPADPVTVTLAPEADTYVNQSGAAVVYGDRNQLTARGGSPLQLTYFRFALPEPPAGTVLASAGLRFTTTTSATAGSADPYAVVPVTGTWDESSTTYANRPSIGTTSLGTLPAGSESGTTYTIDLTRQSVVTNLGSTMSMALTSASTDNIWLWSRERTVAGQRPALVLRFEAP